MAELIKKLREHKKLSDATARQYKGQLNSLANEVGAKPTSIDFLIKHDDEIIEYVNDFDKQSTRKNYFAMIVSVLKGFKAPAKVVNKYAYNMTNLADKMEVEKKNQTASDSTIKNFVHWNKEVADKYEQLKNQALDIIEKAKKRNRSLSKVSLRKIEKWVLLALYYLIPPRRNKDFTNMLVVSKEPSTLESNKNYYVHTPNGPDKLIFNYYKTKKTYGTQKFDVPVELKEVVDAWIDANDGDIKYLLYVINEGKDAPFKEHNIARMFNTMWKGKNVSTSLLRKSYLTHKYGGTLLKEREKDAEMMGHSAEEAVESYVKPSLYKKTKVKNIKTKELDEEDEEDDTDFEDES